MTGRHGVPVMGEDEHPAYEVEEAYRAYNDPGYEYAPDPSNPMEDPATMKVEPNAPLWALLP